MSPIPPFKNWLRIWKPNTAARRTTTVRQQSSQQFMLQLRAIVLSQNFLQMAIIAMITIVAATAIVSNFTGRVLLAQGRIADETRLVRVQFERIDEEATRLDREDAQATSPRVYKTDTDYIEALQTSLASLPESIVSIEARADLPPDIAAQFALDEPAYQAMRRIAQDSIRLGNWRTRVARFASQLQVTPIVTAEELVAITQSRARDIQLLTSETAPRLLSKERAISLNAQELTSELERRANGAGLYGDEARVAITRLLTEQRPLHLFSKEATDNLQAKRAQSIPNVIERYQPGSVIYAALQPVSAEQVALAREEQREYARSLPFSVKLLELAGTVGVAGILMIALAGYAKLYYPRAARNPGRMGAISVLVLGSLALACWGATSAPPIIWFATIGPVVFVSMIICTAYDRRLAVMVASTLSLLIGLTLDLSPGFFIAALIASIVSAWRMSGIRHRNDVLKAGLMVAVALTVIVLGIGLATRPATLSILREITIDAAWAGAAGFLAAAITLATLPTIENVFDITTGMTLSELRDSSHPLLRQLQQRAPGTFNHSHTVAIIASAAADAIGADALHLYVGAMYHDIGKMNKPGYFVENQTASQRTLHEKLSPAMSLLVIVAHVKDGVELARQHGLPRSLHHYIESHHGTTLVQYFFHRAKTQAEEGGADGPSEVEYRYPGPKPQTKEATILMLADSVEAATRAMAEPTPARIGSLVREIGRKYLEDGQFDEAAITLRELNMIEDAVTKSLCSIYHGRIAYPKADEKATRDKSTHPQAKPA